MDKGHRLYHTLLVLLSSIIYITECERARGHSEIVNARIGEQVALTCPDTATFVNWYKDGRELSETEYVRIREDTLRIKNVTLDDQGTYSCKPIGGFGAVQSQNNYTLIIYSADVSVFPENPTLHTTTVLPKTLPYFVERRLRVDGVQRLNRNLSETVSFNCNAGGNPAPTIDWYKGGVRMNYRRQNVVINDYTMKVKDLRLSDAGTYICRLRNDMGSISFTYSLTVKDPLAAYTTVVSPFPLNTSVTLGSTASLHCKVRSNSKPTIMWLRHVTAPSANDMDALINIRDKSYILIKNETQQIESEDDAYMNRLIIPNVGAPDQGIYACVGMDKRGNLDMREARLVVIAGPSTAMDTLESTTADNLMIFGSPSATLAVLIAIPVVIILMITIAIIYGLNKKKKNTASNIRRPPNNMMIDHEVAVPLNMNANNGCNIYAEQYNGSNGSYNKVPLTNSDARYGGDKMYHPPAYRSPTPQQYSQYMQSDGSYRSSLHYPPIAAVHQQSLRKQQQSRSQGDEDYMTDIPDSDSHFSSVSHTRPQYMSNNRNPYDDRDIHSDPPVSRIGLHCPPPPPGSYYSGQW